MCEYRGHRGHQSHHGHCDPRPRAGCCCGPAAAGPGFGFGRRFPTREERVARLKAYLQGLQDEADAVKERIAALEAAD